jgi:hypothetical protein
LNAVIYIDDLFITCVNESAIDDFVSLLWNKFKDLTIHDGLIHSYLGMIWDYSIPGSVKVTMEGYIDDLFEEANVPGTVKTLPRRISSLFASPLL